MKKYLFLSLFVVLAAAFFGCEAVYDDPPASLMPPPPAPVPQQPQAPPFIVLEDPDWETNQAPDGYAPYGNQMAPQPMMYPGQSGQVMMNPQGQPMMAAPGQQQMVYPQGQPMMVGPGQQQMVYPGQPMMMAPGQQPIMMEGDSPEPPGVIYEMPGGPGQPPVIYPQGSFVPDSNGGMMMPQDQEGDPEFIG